MLMPYPPPPVSLSAANVSNSTVLFGFIVPAQLSAVGFSFRATCKPSAATTGTAAARLLRARGLSILRDAQSAKKN